MGRPGPPRTHHKLLDTSRIRTELGFTDVMPFGDAIARMVEWYLEHPLEPGGDDEQRIGDPFDYAAEDACAAALDALVEQCDRLPFAGVTLRHSYDPPEGGGGARTEE